MSKLACGLLVSQSPLLVTRAIRICKELVMQSPSQLEQIIVVHFPNNYLMEEGLRVIRDRLSCLLDRGGKQTIYLDLKLVDSPTADGLGGLIALNSELRAAGHELILCNANNWTFEVFEL